MREILFRGKRKDDGEWVEGYFVNCASIYDDPEIDRVAEIVEVNADRRYIGEYCHLDVYPVEPETVGQYTGFTDKNGKKIFEGDIVTIGSDKNGVAVRYGSRGWECYTDKFGPYWCHCLDKEMTYEIIGNIHDNPELVEVK